MRQCCTRLSNGAQVPSALISLIRSAVFVQKLSVSIVANQVDVRACGDVIGLPGTHFEIYRYPGAQVHQMVTVSSALGKCSAVTWEQNGPAFVFDKREFPFENIDKLVFMTVPVTLTRPLPGWKGHYVYAKVSKSPRIPQLSSRALGTRRIERVWVSRADPHGNS